MNLVTWDPTRDLSLLQGDMNRLFDRFFAPAAGQRERWIPALDVHEEDDSFVVRADLPGMSEEDVTIEVEDRVLRIAGKRENEHEDKGDGYHRIERSYGQFERMLTLPEGVDAEAITASFDKGVLQLRVPKPERARPRRITIGARRQETIEGTEANRHDGQAETKRSLKERVLSHS